MKPKYNKRKKSMENVRQKSRELEVKITHYVSERGWGAVLP
jgi:hypothetical protein